MPPAQAFRSPGFDPLTAVEPRNRLRRASGVALPATAVFDHPTPEALASHRAGLLFPDTGDPGDGAGDERERRIRPPWPPFRSVACARPT